MAPSYDRGRARPAPRHARLGTDRPEGLGSAVLQRGNSYDGVYRGFRWDVPARFNIGVAACDRHADGTGRLALIYEAPDGRVERFTFDDLKRLSHRCANALAGFGVKAGDLPGVLLPHDFFPQAGDLYWTPADWAWIGGLLDVLLPSLYFGVPVLAHRARKFDPDEAFALIARHGVRNAFLPPTALKMMRAAPSPRERFRFDLRSVASGGEALGEDILAWSKEALGIAVNEFYGQTEANLLVGNCASLYPVRPGSMGRPIPGHRVAVVSDQGEPLLAGETGIIAAKRPDPVMFLGYWNNPEATAAKFAGDWLLTGDVALQDGDGYIWYKGREDDLISSGGYRIGPTDIEDCLMKHEAVLMAAAVGHPDPVRGEIVRAFVVPKAGVTAESMLADEIRTFVGERLAWYQAPREIVFVDELPLTATGKIIRRELRSR